MRGHITKRGKNSYSIAVSLGKDTNTGKYKYQWVSVKGTKKEAEKRLSELLNQLDNGTFMKPGKTTLAEYIERWLRDYAWPHHAPLHDALEHAVKMGLLNHNIADAVSPPLCQRPQWQTFSELDITTFLEA